MTLIQRLKQLCETALIAAFPHSADFLTSYPIEITPATQDKFGHYQCNSAMKLAKPLSLTPRQIADGMQQALVAQRTASHPWFEKIEVAGPGFLNLWLHRDLLSEELNYNLRDSRLGVPFPKQLLKVVIDFSSPNTAKEMHVGHLRSTIIGDSLARMLSFMGHDVLRLNHVGDWGTQFGMLIIHLKNCYPTLKDHPQLNLTLADLMQHYREAKARFDADELFKKQAQEAVVALQGGDAQSFALWQQICEISRRAYQEIYDILDIKIVERGESYYNPILPKIIEELQAKNLLTDSDGARCIYLPGFTNREDQPLPLIVQKSDGGYNYATTDLAAVRQRVFEEKADWLIYVVDAGQSQHLQMMYAASRLAGFAPEHVKLDHVAFGLVLREDGKKFKTREGDTEKLIDLLHTAILKAENLLQERNPEWQHPEIQETSHALGINAIKYADLSCYRGSDYVFSYEKMLRFEGNTAAFLLYAYVRVASIKRKTQANIAELLQNSVIQLQEPAELALGLLLAQFPEVFLQTVKELAPNRLTDYLFQVAEKFHNFFHHCRVEGTQEEASRILLCEMVAKILQQGLTLLGLATVARM